MTRTALRLLGIQELAAYLGASTMDVKNWRRRGRLPEPVQVLAYGPVWQEQQFPKKLRDELVAAGDPWRKPSTSPRSGTKRKTTPASKARSRTRGKKG
jgi:hypothetical protein